MSAIGRKCSIVNLDPANEHTSYPCALDVRNLLHLDEVMEEEGLGPNGGVLYALEELERNVEWLEEGLKGLGEDYVLFDCPGQVELFTHHSALRNVFFRLQKLGYRVCLASIYSPQTFVWLTQSAQLVVLSLTDSYVLTLPSLYISALLLSLRSMLQMDLPHLNVLTKIDNLATYAPLPFNLDYYTEVQDLSYLMPHLTAEQPLRNTRFEALNNAIIELVEDFGLVGFETLAVEDKASMMKLLQAVDRAGGYVFGGPEGANDTVWQVAMREGTTTMDVRDVQERWLDERESYDEAERRELEEERERVTRNLEEEEENEEMMAAGELGAGSGIKVVRK
ncbi:MAG: hypothetical protein M1829_003144 [Trizodia sp. TS-e1964]|nr:MAG: hypothetical protein M1829_003144 [Trizodia sp. TS-e1964]